MSRIQVVEDPAAEVARLLVQAAGVTEAHIVLTGGSTPRRAYELAAQAGADWSDATVWFGDERCVPPWHADSNYRLAAGALLAGLSNWKRPVMQRMAGEKGPEAGAADYERRLRAQLGDEPEFELLLLGLGPDGHMASLFPGRPEAQVSDRLVTGVPEAGMEPYVPRISLTVPAIARARRVVFLVSGEAKAEAVARVFGPDPDPDLPATRAPDPLVLLDPAAAARLPA